MLKMGEKLSFISEFNIISNFIVEKLFRILFKSANI